jgi:hypothetical protein
MSMARYRSMAVVRAARAGEGRTGRDNFLGEVDGGIGPRPDVRWARPDRRRCGHVAGPDQDVAILINGHLLGLDELDLEIVEGVIVQVELPFERAIGHAASTVEHGQGLVHNLLEGHRRPSTALALVPRNTTSVKVRTLGKEHREYTRKLEACRRNCTALQGASHGGDREEDGTVSEKGNGLSPSIT